MESWLTDVKRVRIPRPKFASARHPREPPKDYCGGGAASAADAAAGRPDADQQRRDAALASAAEQLRIAVRDKL